MGITIFWGQFGLPIPFPAKVTMVIGKPIPPPAVKDLNDKEELSGAVNDLHETFMKAIVALFDRYKGLAGYPESSLDIL